MTKFAFSFFAVIIMLTLVIIKMANSAPTPTVNRQKQNRYRTTNRLDHQNNYLTHFTNELPWYNPCKGVANENVTPKNRELSSEALKPLKHTINRIKSELYGPAIRAINTDSIHSWFIYNDTYKFLTKLNLKNPNVTLLKWHTNVQIYVGAFEYLEYKQNKYDERKNFGNNISKELKRLLNESICLLCEIEAAINRTSSKMPTVFTREVMEKKLKFRNNNKTFHDLKSIDDIDNMFAKIRFMEYINDLQRILSQGQLNKHHTTQQTTHKMRHPKRNNNRKNNTKNSKKLNKNMKNGRKEHKTTGYST